MKKEIQKINQMRDEIDISRQQHYEKLVSFTGGVSWNEKYFFDLALRSKEQMASGLINYGKALFVLKEMSDHGRFLELLGMLNQEPRSANNYMRVALKFSGFDPELIEDLGVSKLYAMLKAPAEELQRLEQEQKFVGMEQEELLAISARDLQARIRESNDKLKFDLQTERDAKNVLFEEKRQLEKDNKHLHEALVEAKTGAKPADQVPEWWGEFNQTLGALEAFSIALAGAAPDLQDEKISKQCRMIIQRIDGELAHVYKYLGNFPVDPVEHRRASREKIAALENDSRFDFDKLNEEST